MNDNHQVPPPSANEKADLGRDEYARLISEIFTQLKEVLDEHVVVKTARTIEGLHVNDSGQVQSLDGDPQEIVQRVVDRFVGLSNALIVKTLQPLLKQCPWVKIPLTNP